MRFSTQLVLAGTLSLLAGCGGSGGSTPAGPAPGPSPTPAPTATPSPSATPTPTPPTGTSCPYGVGNYYAQCDRTSPVFLPDVDHAIDQLVQDRPDLFDQSNTAGPGAYYVLDPDQYFEGVVQNLEGTGFCAEYGGFGLQVKNSNDFSERYDILLGSGHIRRGDGSYRATCNPAAFPVNPADVIRSVRVAFYEIKCPAGETPPPNGEGRLPVGCTGIVTATPKDANGNDVDARIHGPDIEWTLVQDARFVDVEDYPGEEFNRYATGKSPGSFQLCATVQTVQGCLDGEVIP